MPSQVLPGDSHHRQWELTVGYLKFKNVVAMENYSGMTVVMYTDNAH